MISGSILTSFSKLFSSSEVNAVDAVDVDNDAKNSSKCFKIVRDASPHFSSLHAFFKNAIAAPHFKVSFAVFEDMKNGFELSSMTKPLFQDTDEEGNRPSSTISSSESKRYHRFIASTSSSSSLRSIFLKTFVVLEEKRKEEEEEEEHRRRHHFT